MPCEALTCGIIAPTMSQRKISTARWRRSAVAVVSSSACAGSLPGDGGGTDATGGTTASASSVTASSTTGGTTASSASGGGTSATASASGTGTTQGSTGGTDGTTTGDTTTGGAVEGWLAVAAGGEHTCAIDAARHLWCWGNNSRGAVGIGDPMGPDVLVTEPRMVSETKTWKSVAAGGYHTCAIDTDGGLFCWGSNSWGQVGVDATMQFVWIPYPASANVTWSSVAAGDAFTCGVSNLGWTCWGNNESGQLGNGTTSTVADDIIDDFDVFPGFSEIHAGARHACAIDEADSDRLYCWGENTSGQTGRPVSPSEAEPKAIAATLQTQWTWVSAGGRFSCGYNAAQMKFYCWGANDRSQLANEFAANPSTDPKPVTAPVGLRSYNIGALGLGDEHACVVTDGRLFCWGADDREQLGDGAGMTDVAVLTEIGDFGWVAVSAGRDHTCAIRDDGSLWCWGANTMGQLGLGDTLDRNEPTMVVVTM
ncbi:MAG: hypothetical protein D6705_00055 [Deltaproteobacteria bacterium]|nr:MAG: hypothetical protein D6705_00055 [Deltaproteobacteria bacterium]